jgi:polyisoprenoid-binding protein YceI
MPDRSVRLARLMVRSVLSALLLVAAAGRSPAAAGARTFVADPAKSRVKVHVGKAGLFKFAGHEHDVEAPLAEGQILADPQDLRLSSVRLRFEASALRLNPAGEPPQDVPKVEEAMRGPRVLDVVRFAAITFVSASVTGREVSPAVYELRVEGPLTIRDREVRVGFTVRVSVSGDRLTATGQGRLRQTDFGIEPVSVAGVVKVKNELDLDLHLEALAVP